MPEHQTIVFVICIAIIFIGALSFFTVKDYTDATGKKSLEKANELESLQKLTIESAYGNEIVVRNNDNTRLIMNDVVLYADKKIIECIWDNWVIGPGEVSSCTIKENCTGKYITGQYSAMNFRCS